MKHRPQDGRGRQKRGAQVHPTADKSYHMSPEAFRRYGREVVDWIADYYENIEGYPVLSTVKPGEIRSGLPASPPQTGKGFDSFLKDMSDKILPGVTHWQSPNFFAAVHVARDRRLHPGEAESLMPAYFGDRTLVLLR